MTTLNVRDQIEKSIRERRNALDTYFSECFKLIEESDRIIREIKRLNYEEKPLSSLTTKHKEEVKENDGKSNIGRSEETEEGIRTKG